MMKQLLIAAALVCAPATALAQTDVEATGSQHEAGHTVGAHGDAAHGAHHADPSKHFNWFDVGYKKKDIAGGKLGDGEQNGEPGEEPMSAPFALMLLNFGILLVILAKLGGPAARKMAETRSDQIKGALDEAAKLRQAAADKLDEYSTKLTAAEAEMKSMLDGMRADAEAERARIVTAAEAQAAAVKKDAEQRIAAEIQRARVELAREVSLAATAAAEQLLRDKATAADHTKLIDTFVKDVEAAAGRQGAV
jgi:F-type H+-transporting ATPase subunit b